MHVVAEKTYTPEDLLSMPDGKNYELVDGHLVERNMSRLIELGRRAELSAHRHLRRRRPARLGLAGRTGLCLFPRRPEEGPDARCLVRAQGAPAGRAHITKDTVYPPRPCGRGRLTERYGLRGRGKVIEYLERAYRSSGSLIPESRTVHSTVATARWAGCARTDELSGEDVVPGFRCRCRRSSPRKRSGALGRQLNRRDGIGGPRRRRCKKDACRCAESSVTQGTMRPRRSWSPDCAGSNIAATTAPGWPRSTATD